MFYSRTNSTLCEDCAKDLNFTYNNLNRAKICLSEKEYNEVYSDRVIQNLSESWITTVNPPANVQTDESCLFMLNFNRSFDTMVTSSVNVIQIWDNKTKQKTHDLTDHKEIVTGVEWFNSPQEDIFISCSLDKTMKIWKNYECKQTLTHHDDWLRCMSISFDNQYLISGCVSSVIKGYDLQKNQALFSLTENEGGSALNTVNSLDFQKDSFVFLSGTRDGYIRLYDLRTPIRKPFQEIYSHNMKLNCATFGQNTNMILSAGRDSTARLWDLRLLKPLEITKGIKEIKDFVVEYKGHSSHGYNIASHFFVNDKFVITGSEDGHIYIYHTDTGRLVRKIKAGTKIIHLLKPFPNPEVGFAYSGLQKSTVHFYDSKTVDDLKPKKEAKPQMEPQENEVMESAMRFIEEFMSENSDLILKVFHSHNITYSSGMTWENLLRVIIKEEDEESRKLHQKLNEVLFQNIYNHMNPKREPNPETNKPEKPKETPRILRDIQKKLENCPKCKSIAEMKIAELNGLTENCDILKNLP